MSSKKRISIILTQQCFIFSSAVVHDGIVYVSGQLLMDTEKGRPIEGEIEEQARAALESLSEVLDTAGSSKDNVLRTTAYISDVSLRNRVNEAYAEFFGDRRPARTVVPTAKKHYGCLIEIDVVAIVDKKESSPYVENKVCPV
jgi:2-iminobutanoate/2-iminopropanoate deaminase